LLSHSCQEEYGISCVSVSRATAALEQFHPQLLRLGEPTELGWSLTRDLLEEDSDDDNGGGGGGGGDDHDSQATVALNE